MGYGETIILGIIEGFTEFLPISSTAHLILSGRLLKVPSTEFFKSFEIAIQLGAILAVVFWYKNKLKQLDEILTKVLVAFVPTGLMGFLFYPLIKKALLEKIEIVIWALLGGGAVMILLETWGQKHFSFSTVTREEITFKQAWGIGLCQSLAIIPGVSRAAATIFGGMFWGLSRPLAVEFSFLLAVPTMLAATGWDLLKTGGLFLPQQWLTLLMGLVVSFVAALIGIKFLLRLVQHHNFIVFGLYRLAAAVLFWFLLF